MQSGKAGGDELLRGRERWDEVPQRNSTESGAAAGARLLGAGKRPCTGDSVGRRRCSTKRALCTVSDGGLLWGNISDSTEA